MKIKAWEEDKKEEEILTVRLKEDEDGGITLISVKENGSRHYAILRIRPDGCLYRFGSIGSIGLTFNSRGEIALTEEEED
jgi:hypothetical protein